MTSKSDDRIAAGLAGMPGPAAGEWERMRGALAARAEAGTRLPSCVRSSTRNSGCPEAPSKGSLPAGGAVAARGSGGAGAFLPLHEAHDEIQSDEPLLCPHCGHVVPDMAFCPACGVATWASSRSSRTARRDLRPVRSDQESDGS